MVELIDVYKWSTDGANIQQWSDADGENPMAAGKSRGYPSIYHWRYHRRWYN